MKEEISFASVSKHKRTWLKLQRNANACPASRLSADSRYSSRDVQGEFACAAYKVNILQRWAIVEKLIKTVL
jgi:hypothetical protein